MEGTVGAHDDPGPGEATLQIEIQVLTISLPDYLLICTKFYHFCFCFFSSVFIWLNVTCEHLVGRSTVKAELQTLLFSFTTILQWLHEYHE